MSRLVILTALAALGGLSIGANPDVQAQQPQVRDIQKVKDNLYFISGGDTYDRPSWTGGNVAVWVTDAGVVLVDTMLKGNGHAILDRVRSVTTKPVTMIINTHTHSDHTGSNTEFSPNVEFVAHENTKANLSKSTCPPVTNCAAFAGENATFLPKKSFKDHMSLFTGKDRIDLYYFGRGHTNGDAWIVFPAVRAMHTGDMFQRKNMPAIDATNNGGSASEFNATLQKALAGIKNVDTVIGGHTPAPVTWADFQEFTAFYQDFVTSVQSGLRTGKSVDEVAGAYHLPQTFVGYQADPGRVKANVQSIADALRK